MTTTRLMQGPTCGPDFSRYATTFGPLPETSPEDLLSTVGDSGLRGRGGAWFPTARKMQSVISNTARHGRKPVVVGNAMEGEPAASGDNWIATNQPHLIFDGLELASRIVGADRAYLAFHADSQALDVATAALEQRPGGGVHVEIVAAPPRYAASEETALVNFISTGHALPVYGERPYVHGVEGRPTLENNAETLAHLALIARHGATWFRAEGTPDAPGTTLISIGGSVHLPTVAEFATGTPIRSLIEEAGGLTGTLTGIRVGGFGGTWASPAFLDSTWDPDEMRKVGLAAGAGILRPISEQYCPLVETALDLDYLAGESAGQCGVCIFGLSAVADAMLDLAHLRSSADAVAQLERQLAAIPRRGGCSLPDGAVRMAQSALAVFSHEVDAHVKGQCTATDPLPGGQWTPVPPRRPHPVAAPGRNLK